MLIGKLNAIVQEITYSFNIRNRRKQIPIIQEIDRIRGNARYHDARSLIPFGGKIYSQSDEDGIIREIFRRIGLTNRVFVEFGIGNGLENNTLALLFEDWQGLWIDASSRSIKQIREKFAAILAKEKLKVVQSFITKENINHLISENIDDTEIDLLSIDIDGNDYHILNAITCVAPRVVVVEYNAKFAPPTLFCMDYDETHTWKKDDCFGASLKFLEVNLERKGYCLVGCNVSGVNAFFVRRDLISDQFLAPFTAETHYEPARYYLSGYVSGHPASYETLAKSLTMRSQPLHKNF
ncbi:MAG: FkbM family methyltransferase [Leptolyngbyaceae cyanobacterium]